MIDMKVLFVLRKKIGLTQLELATRTNLTQAEISLGENGYDLRRLDRIQAELRKYSQIRDLVPDNEKDLLIDWDEYNERRLRAEISAELAKVS